MESKNILSHLRNTQTEQTLTLPEEIIEEILLRLPVKSLLKFRCVSKSWRSLIGSKRFIKTHLEYSVKNTTFSDHSMILNACSHRRGLGNCSLHSMLNETSTDSFSLDDSLLNIAQHWRELVGCCNGLVCVLLNRHDFMLWNPSTRMFKKLPEINRKANCGFLWCITNYGFGYDESSGDYNVFCTAKFETTGGWQSISELYSLKTNSWKVMSIIVSTATEKMSFAGGKLHWVSGSGRYITPGCQILSFDLKSEECGLVKLPCFSEGYFYGSLRVLGGCLCLITYRQHFLEIWVMKQYGVKESWDKVVTLPHLDWQDWPITPLQLSQNEEILLVFKSGVVIYNPKDNGYQCREITILNSIFQVDMYIESLVSPGADGEQEPQRIPQKMQLHEGS